MLLGEDFFHVCACHVHRFELRPIIRQSELSGDDLMASGATELLETLRFMLFFCAAIYRLNLCDDVHGGEQRDATLKILAYLLATIVEPEFSAGTHRVTSVAVMMFEDIRGQLVGSLAGEIRAELRFRPVRRLILGLRRTCCRSRSLEMCRTHRGVRRQAEAASEAGQNEKHSPRGLPAEKSFATLARTVNEASG